TGDGVVVQLDDARNVSVTARDLDRSICHSTDLTDIVNTAWKGGAEAIAINDERIVNSSSVYCVGSTIMVNGTLMSPPFNVTVIGPQNAPLGAFDDQRHIQDNELRAEIFDLRRDADNAQNEVASGRGTLTEGQRQLQQLRVFSAESAVAGPGIVIRIEGAFDERAMSDLVNELRNAGAEAIG